MPCAVELEIAIDAPCGAELESLGITRAELCSELRCDGLTPSRELLAGVRATYGGHLAVLVRRTADGFCAEGTELRALVDDIRMARDNGADSIVAGVLRTDGTIDTDATLTLMHAAGPLPFTFHRAFDRLADLPAGYRELANLGVRRLLTSGGAPTATAGADMLATLGRLAQTEGGPLLMAGGGIRANNALQVARITGVAAIHRSGMLQGAFDLRGVAATLAVLRA